MGFTQSIKIVSILRHFVKKKKLKKIIRSRRSRRFAKSKKEEFYQRNR